MIKMFEVVEYRHCNCGKEGCPGERQFVLFQHESEEECKSYIIHFPEKIGALTEVLIFNDTDKKIEIKVHLTNGLIATRRLRIQEFRLE